MQIEEPFGILALGAPWLLSQRTPRSLHSSMSPLAALSPCSRSANRARRGRRGAFVRCHAWEVRLQCYCHWWRQPVLQCSERL